MDGFDSNSAVIVLGATKQADILDPTLRRPSRFDRVVMVETPDRAGREAILEVHVSKKELPLGKDVHLSDIASMTTGFTGADLANLVNEAALLAGRKSKHVVEKIDFIEAVERSIADGDQFEDEAQVGQDVQGHDDAQEEPVVVDADSTDGAVFVNRSEAEEQSGTDNERKPST